MIKKRFAEVLVSLGICALAAWGMYWWAMRPDYSPITATRSRIGVVTQLVLEFQKTTGHLPGFSIWRNELASPTLAKYPDLFKDCWGMDLQYKVLDDGRGFIVYSYGPNKKDDAGLGDDVVNPPSQK